ncbi:MAG: carbohydrate kinase [Planctomycetes bacterium]|nr:carbohydrate kinase [Planctomycetota bacterium]
MTPQRLAQLIEHFPSTRIAVVGDFFLDKYQEIDPALDEVSVETGLAAHQVVRKWHSPGAAGTVVNNLRGLGAGRLFAVGITGDEGEAFELRRALNRQMCDVSALLAFADLFTPVYHKTLVRGKAGLEAERERYDTKNRSALPAQVENLLIEQLDTLWPEVDTIVVADQVEEEDRGVITTGVREYLISRALSDRQKIVWADSRRRIGLFTGMYAKPNETECVRAIEASQSPAHHAERFPDETVIRCGRALQERLAMPVFVTRGQQGIWIFKEDGIEKVRGVSVPEPTDTTGAGDSATAGAVMALAAGATLAEAALMANLVASLTVQQLGTTGIATPDQLPARLALWHP